MQKTKIVLATGNQDKVKEMADILSGFGFEVLPQTQFNLPSVEETGLTFVENALLKARFAAKMTDLPAIADDSGLCVDALNGEPGLYSARYAGEEHNYRANCEQVLAKLADTPDEARTAKFVTCLVFLRHELDPNPIIALGEYQGQILREFRGENGFGYDPIFFSFEENCTFAQLESARKKQISHRARALQSLKQQLGVSL
ncbi:non-canonical purine NTP pyrophosphatase, RdgB/HAM1 family [Pasteurellaceae bacterium RH1A]|nr:non-canonical purine NTP pyrophosphatase, RdgB/HAM1 family [Pasteurellaceae bacterium RH1A]